MSTVPYQNETKTTDLGGTCTTHGMSLPNFKVHWVALWAMFFVTYDITPLTKGEGPHLLATRRQTMSSVWTNKVVFFQGHMCEY